MPRRPPAFQQDDLKRALRGAIAAGVEIRRIEIDSSGKIVLVTGKPDTSEEELDRELAELEALAIERQSKNT